MSNLADSFESLYDLLEKGDARAALLIDLRSRLSDRCVFDPVTGLEVEQGSAQFAAREIDRDHIHDYLWYIVTHALEAFCHLTEELRSNILREHVVMPAYQARELDTTSAIWLSRRPGRNVREKINHTQGRIMAVQRRFSHDTVENRLLKAFAKRIRICLERYLYVHGMAAEPCMEEMYRHATRWLRSEEAEEIGEWCHVPPNNTLLQHRLYRKIWDAWLRLSRMDSIVESDSANLCAHYFLSMAWDIIARLRETFSFRLLQQPVDIRYEDFSLSVSSSLAGWMPDGTGQTVCSVPLFFEIHSQGFIISVGKSHALEVKLSEDGEQCLLPDGSTRTNIWNIAAFGEIEDIMFTELMYAEDKPLLAVFSAQEEALRSCLSCVNMQPVAGTDVVPFNDLYEQIVQVPWENIALRLHAFCQEYGIGMMLRGVHTLFQSYDFDEAAGKILRHFVFELTALSEWSEFCETGEEHRTQDTANMMLAAIMEDAGQQNKYGDYMTMLAAKAAEPEGLQRKAWHWYQRAAEAGDEWGLFHAGMCLENGCGCPEDKEKAKEYYERSGTDWACFRLGLIADQNEDYSAARAWLKKSQELGNEKAAAQLKEIDKKHGIQGVLNQIFN